MNQTLKRWIGRGVATLAGLAIAVVAIGAASPVNEREVSSKPEEVTVYPDGARVERKADAELPAGPVTAVFADLPSSADENSLRLAVKGPQGTKFHGVRMRSTFTNKAVEKRVRDIREKMRVAEDKKAEIEDRITGRNAELEILKSLARDSTSRNPTGPGGDLSKIAEGSKTIGKRIQELLSESRKDVIAKRELDEEIGLLSRELQQAGAGQTDRRVAEAELTMARGGKVEFTLSYFVRDAGWKPVYDLTLESANKEPKVTIAQAATVRQRSGEDWDGVKLTLSTARPTAASQIPDPTNWWLDLWKPQPQPVYRKSRAARAGVFAPESAAPAMAEGAGYAQPEPVEVEMDEAQTERAEFATSFRIARPVLVQSGGEARRVGIGEAEHTADLTIVAVPRLAQAAFVEAKLEYQGEQPLLPGQAQLFHAGEFVGTVSLPSVGPGEHVTLGFGQDPNVKVERKLSDTKQADKGMLGLGKASRRYRWVTTLTSTHPTVRQIEVREQLPRSRHAEITVEAEDMSPEPANEDPNIPGLKKFKLDLKPGKASKVVFGYVVRYPQNTRVSGLE